MKSLYIIPFLALGCFIYAQERKAPEFPQENQEQIVKEAKERQAQLMKSLEENAPKKQGQVQLVSEEGLATKQKQETKAQSLQSNNNLNTDKLLPNTATLEEILATIPNRQKPRKTIDSRNTNPIQGLPNTATLEEIKKTIPKN